MPINLTVQGILERVLRLPSVASKRYLTNKVDRCVTGLIAQQQCVGPLHTPLANVAVTAISHFSTVKNIKNKQIRKIKSIKVKQKCSKRNIMYFILQVGIATSIGEQPIKGLVNPAAGARMTVAEALSNLVFAQISNIQVIYEYVLI